MAYDVERKFHEDWIGMVQPAEGLVVSIPVLFDAQVFARQQDVAKQAPVETAVAPYRRPQAREYVVAPGEDRFAGQDLLSAPHPTLLEAIREVVELETPIHEDNLCARIADMWGCRLGKHIRARIEQTALSGVQAGRIRRRGAFYWGLTDDCTPRARSGMKVDADRIAPEEYRATALAVLASGHSFPRPDLIAEVRSVLGLRRTGALLEDAITAVIDAMLQDGVLGEGSAGLRLREGAPVPT